MKTTTATIRFVLITSRTNKKGECPIVLRVQWNGRKEKYTGFSVPKLKWDAKNECVKPCKSLPYALINETLIKTKSKLLKKKALYESKGMPYTAADLLSENEPVAFDKRFSSLLRRMIDSKKLSTNTIWSYNASLKRVETYFGEGVDVCSFNDANLTGFCKWMKSQGYSDSTVNTNMACIKSVVAFAASSGVDVVNLWAGLSMVYSGMYRVLLLLNILSRRGQGYLALPNEIVCCFIGFHPFSLEKKASPKKKVTRRGFLNCRWVCLIL